jgi:hypothetical protein
MLSQEELDAIAAAAHNGETGFALELMRALARSGRIEALPQLVAEFARSVEINRAPVRNFLAHRVPGILANHYFPAALPQHRGFATSATYQDFIQYTLDHRGWEEPIVHAIVEDDAADLTAAVRRILDGVLERHTNAHESP